MLTPYIYGPINIGIFSINAIINDFILSTPIVVSLCLTPYNNRVLNSIPYIKELFIYFFLIGNCLGGSSLKYSNSRLITSDTGRACSSLILSRNFFIDSVVLKAMYSDLFSFIAFIMLNIITLFIKENIIILCKTI